MKAIHRIRDKDCFDQVFKKTDCKVKTHAFTLLISRHSHTRNQLGFILPKKHIKKAVHRNRIKRLTRQYFDHNLCKNLSVDLVLLSRPGITKLLREPYATAGSDNLLNTGRCGCVWTQLHTLWCRFNTHSWYVELQNSREGMDAS